MQSLLYPRFTFIYAILSILVIVADVMDLTWTYYLTKPMVLLVLFFFYRIQTGAVENKTFRNLMLAGFLFSALGDALLMFVEMGQPYFIGGLVAFLIAHICYTAGFINDIFRSRPWNQHWGQLALSTLVVVYGAEFYILNRFSFESLAIPVMIYCAGITVMGVSAVMRDRTKNWSAYVTVCIGALFFIISDSLLATNLFVTKIPFAGELILSTYYLAQYLIGIGTLAKLKNQNLPLLEKAVTSEP